MVSASNEGDAMPMPRGVHEAIGYAPPQSHGHHCYSGGPSLVRRKKCSPVTLLNPLILTLMVHGLTERFFDLSHVLDGSGRARLAASRRCLRGPPGRHSKGPDRRRLFVNKLLTMLLCPDEGHSGYLWCGVSRNGTPIAPRSNFQFVAPPSRSVAGRLAY
ncbi:MAG: hypothetical protein QOJ04_1214 [Caballeronia sp.]|nr:hypothetical protein [Caballeronia sp.]